MGDLGKKAALLPNQNQPKEPTTGDGSMVQPLLVSKRFPVQTHRYVCMYVCTQVKSLVGPLPVSLDLRVPMACPVGSGLLLLLCFTPYQQQTTKGKKKGGKKISLKKFVVLLLRETEAQQPEVVIASFVSFEITTRSTCLTLASSCGPFVCILVSFAIYLTNPLEIAKS